MIQILNKVINKKKLPMPNYSKRKKKKRIAVNPIPGKEDIMKKSRAGAEDDQSYLITSASFTAIIYADELRRSFR